jgi:hypothetical protein
MRRAFAWLVALPLIGGATAAAHALDYRLVVPNPTARATLLAATGHGTEDWLPLGLGAGAAAVLVALTIRAVELRGRRRAPSVAPFLVLPSLSFVAQEHLERFLHDGTFPWHLVTDPTFAPGLALTIPFGFAAYLAARALLYVARAVVQAFEPHTFSHLAGVQIVAPHSATVVRVPVLASRHATRGPPAVR